MSVKLLQTVTVAIAALALATALGCATKESDNASQHEPSETIGIASDSPMPEEANLEEDRNWIREHPEEIDFEGEVVQEKLLALAEKEDEAVEFVRHFAERYPAYDATGDKGSAYTDDTPIPHLYQWDPRWGYTVYSSTAFGLTGCGPTAFAMAYQGATGKTDRSPYDMGLLAQEMGYMAQFEGTPATFFAAASPQVGIECRSIGIDESSLKDALEAGDILIANVGHGYFSRFDGHYLVLTGLSEEDELTMNDPYSAVHSNQTWDIGFILDQTKGLYAFSAQ